MVGEPTVLYRGEIDLNSKRGPHFINVGNFLKGVLSKQPEMVISNRASMLDSVSQWLVHLFPKPP